MNRRVVVSAFLALAVGGGCASDPSSSARLANTLAQVTVLVGAPLAVGAGLSRCHDANLRDADGRLVPVERQEGRQQIVEGVIVGGVAALVAGISWGYMVSEDARYDAAAKAEAPSAKLLLAGAMVDAPPAPQEAPDAGVALE